MAQAHYFTPPPPPPPKKDWTIGRIFKYVAMIGCLGIVLLVVGVYLLLSSFRPPYEPQPFVSREMELENAVRVGTGEELRRAIAEAPQDGTVLIAEIPGLGDTVRVSVESSRRSRGTNGKDVTPGQCDAFEFVRDNYQSIKPEALRSMLDEYQTMRRQIVEDPHLNSFKSRILLGVFGFPGFDEMFPVLDTAGQLEQRLEYPMLFIHDTEKNGMAYVTVQFYAAWNSEDDTYGVRLHRDRIVYFGVDPDYAFVKDDDDVM